MKVLVVQNDPKGVIGEFGRFLQERHDATLEIVGPSLAALDGVAPDAADFFVIMGSPHSVYEKDVPWIASEIELTRRLVAHERPLLGICFGAQILAAAIGGSVASTGKQHVGWFPVDQSKQPVFDGPWFRWHGDAVTLPEGVPVLARSGDLVLAFRSGSAIGVQFHPEMTPAILKSWVNSDGARGRLRALGIDADALLATAGSRCEAASPRARALLDYVVNELTDSADRIPTSDSGSTPSAAR